MSFRIGPWRIDRRAVLAPMSGVSDLPFRRLAGRFGAGFVVSEMVASEALVTGHHEMLQKAELLKGEGHGPSILQLAGRQAQWMARAAELAEGLGADVIDINMGCPARKVTNGLSGSALMRDLDHALTLIDAVVGSVKVPVTLKMRLGWDHDTINAPDLARRAVNSGVQLITVHGRTRQQFFTGAADWRAVAAVKAAVSVPVIVNGDITDKIAACAALDASGADAVMIGRASYGQPWFIGAIADQIEGRNAVTPSLSAVRDLVLEHAQMNAGFYGEALGLRCFRKHLAAYLDVAGWSLRQPALRKRLISVSSVHELHQLMGGLDVDRPIMVA
jgi:tRNA-dihydrouridine synthase B